MYRSILRGSAVAAAAFVVTSPGAFAQSGWNWEGRLAPGQTVEVVGIAGDVRAAAGSGQARVRATKTATRGNIDDVPIVVVEHAGGVTICAVYPSQPGREANYCEPGGGTRNTSATDVRVDFVIEVPPGVHFTGSTVHGDVHAAGLSGDVAAATVSGSIQLRTSGAARASTVNGSIDASMGAGGNTPATFSSVNGGIRLEVAGDLHADFNASTVNGDIESDYPIMVMGRSGPRSVNGTIGRGGRPLRVTTVNGNIEIRRR